MKNINGDKIFYTSCSCYTKKFFIEPHQYYKTFWKHEYLETIRLTL